jgi:hypothetical protein
MNSRTLLYPVTLVLLLLPRIAIACAIGPKPTVLEAYKDADVVVIARAISVEKVSDQSQAPLKSRPFNDDGSSKGIQRNPQYR